LHRPRDAASGHRGRARPRRRPAAGDGRRHRRGGRPMRTPATTTTRTTSQVDEFAVFCQGIQRLTGLDLSQYKRAQMERRIRTFIDRRGHEGLSAYLQVLRADGAELEAFLDRVTINVSELWRHP